MALKRAVLRQGEAQAIEVLPAEEAAALRAEWALSDEAVAALRRLEADKDYALRRRARYAEELRASQLDSELETLGHVVDDIGQAVAEILDHLESQGTRLPAQSFRATWERVLAIKAAIPKS